MSGVVNDHWKHDPERGLDYNFQTFSCFQFGILRGRRPPATLNLGPGAYRVQSSWPDNLVADVGTGQDSPSHSSHSPGVSHQERKDFYHGANDLCTGKK